MKIQIPDLEIEVMGDIVRLEQGAGLCETAVVDVHRIQLAHIASLMGVIERPDLAAQVDVMGDAIVDLRNEIARLAKLLDAIPSFPPGKETNDVTAAFALLDSADRLCDKFGLCEPLEREKATPPEPEKGHATREKDEAVIATISQALRSGKTKQSEIVAHCKAGGIGWRTVQRALKDYSKPPLHLWTREPGFERNAWLHTLIDS